MFQAEARANVDELGGVVKRIAIIESNKQQNDVVEYEIELLEGNKIKVEFHNAKGYFCDGVHYESMQQLLSARSMQYRMEFVRRISAQLASKQST